MKNFEQSYETLSTYADSAGAIVWVFNAGSLPNVSEKAAKAQQYAYYSFHKWEKALLGGHSGGASL